MKNIKKVLVIGSGPIVIGQAAEFDYAGTQACRVLRRQGVEIILVNSNPATIMTDSNMADKIYIEPLTIPVLKRIILKEKPDSIIAALGGQTGLTLATQLDKEGFLSKNNVQILGTSIDGINKAEDRQLFKESMKKISIPTIPSDTSSSLDKSIEIAEKIGYPVIIRPAFTLGGEGGGVAYSKEELINIASNGINVSPIHQVLIEKYIFGYEEFEFEVIRDCDGNTVTVCSMENVDPVGVHTGDSIVVAPALTLDEKNLDILRNASLKIVEELNIVGSCNCQFAYDPKTSKYYVIEVNPRVSRSSALASKATGYPIAKVATLVSLGYKLSEITFDKNAKGTAHTDPKVDYIVLKLPRWPFDKFTNVNRTLGTQMKATGEIMAIGSSVEEALMKAVRGAEINQETLNLNKINPNDIENKLHCIDDLRIFTIFKSLKMGISTDKIHEITKINPFFISKVKNLVNYEKEIENNLTNELYIKGKKLGYTDHALENISNCSIHLHLNANYKPVDTCDGAFGKSSYYYSYYDENVNKKDDNKKQCILVVGSGPIRIGQGIEFDYSSVKCVEVLRKLEWDVVIINNNPETVSTDYDICDRLYFEPITPEDVLNVIKKENPIGVVVAFGGQTAIKLVKYLSENGINILGTSANAIDIAENREKFDSFLENIGISRPKAVTARTYNESLIATEVLGFPILLRPSYVIGGQGMRVVRNSKELKLYMETILSDKSISNSVLIDKYMPGIELEIDCIFDGNDILIPGIMEHIERAGIHSGDSIAVYPAYSINSFMKKKIYDTSFKIVCGLKAKGIFNIQYLINNNELYVIEVNPRASRTIPYISKVTGIPMIELATRVMLGEKLEDMGYVSKSLLVSKYHAVKVPVFSFEKISDADSIMGPEMKSTGEVLGIGRTKTEALYKGLIAAGIDINSYKLNGQSAGILISVEDYDYSDAIKLAEKFTDLGIKLYATPDTAKTIRSKGLDVTTVRNVWENSDIYDLIDNKKINYIVYTGAIMDSSVGDFRSLRLKAMKNKILCITSIDTALGLADVISAHYTQDNICLVNINEIGETK